MRQTHTYVTLPISAAAFNEIKSRLIGADYTHTLNDDGTEIGLTGIAIIQESEEDNA